MLGFSADIFWSSVDNFLSDVGWLFELWHLVHWEHMVFLRLHLLPHVLFLDFRFHYPSRQGCTRDVDNLMETIFGSDVHISQHVQCIYTHVAQMLILKCWNKCMRTQLCNTCVNNQQMHEKTIVLTLELIGQPVNNLLLVALVYTITFSTLNWTLQCLILMRKTV